LSSASALTEPATPPCAAQVSAIQGDPRLLVFLPPPPQPRPAPLHQRRAERIAEHGPPGSSWCPPQAVRT